MAAHRVRTANSTGRKLVFTEHMSRLKLQAYSIPVCTILWTDIEPQNPITAWRKHICVLVSSLHSIPIRLKLRCDMSWGFTLFSVVSFSQHIRGNSNCLPITLVALILAKIVRYWLRPRESESIRTWQCNIYEALAPPRPSKPPVPKLIFLSHYTITTTSTEHSRTAIRPTSTISFM